ncbi:MAG: homocysteine S-methyltransferase family protein [Deltaproteobacteria bacterium]|nr:homocysteine S-methyltransferase family protein [Deltaproteobacteria bacterium]
MTLIDELLANGPALLDGAWGTELQARGLTLGEVPDFWNLEHAERVEQVARAYVEAGSDIILTNTFRANNIALANHADVSQLDRVNRAGVEISKRAAGERARVFASIGPSGKLLMRGQVDEASLRKSFEQQARALAAGGADAIVVETMGDLEEARFAIDAARATGLPVAACMVYDSGKKKDRTMMGVPPAQAAEALSEAGADVIGANCGNGIDGYIPICAQLAAATDRPIWIKANAGLPTLEGGEVVYRTTPDEFASHLDELVAAGASFIGGCCGTNPAFIALLRTRLDARASARRPQ